MMRDPEMTADRSCSSYTLPGLYPHPLTKKTEYKNKKMKKVKIKNTNKNTIKIKIKIKINQMKLIIKEKMKIFSLTLDQRKGIPMKIQLKFCLIVVKKLI
jgi:hypothetical protein